LFDGIHDRCLDYRISEVLRVNMEDYATSNDVTKGGNQPPVQHTFKLCKYGAVSWCCMIVVEDKELQREFRRAFGEDV
jgi:hypothetical protein